jgi:hypothetical protein
MKVQLVTPYRVSHLKRYDVTVRGKVTTVYPPLHLQVPPPTHPPPLRTLSSHIRVVYYRLPGSSICYRVSRRGYQMS